MVLIGAHTSISGGVHKALLRGAEIGATTVQIFTSNQKQWHGAPIPEKEVDLWFETLEATGLQKIMSHDSYLINLGSPKPDLRAKSQQAFSEELSRCHQLNLSFLNFHPGTATGSSEEDCLDAIIESLLSFEKQASQGNTRLLIEATAGQGTVVGYTFPHLDYIIQGVKHKLPIGVCIDTCHIFAAGYDLRTKESCDATLTAFEKIVGIKHLYAFHLNDSQKPLGARVDRHANLGEGEIGMDCFEFLMNDPRTNKLPKYLETPNGETKWKDEIAHLKKIYHPS
ncbi:MAG: deoxyribonuclease IV [Simkaniaceae bacterium]|nr:deoxyribonuclease IV [Simkaniaceae bacterium]